MGLYGHWQYERLKAKDLKAESSKLKAQRKCNGQLTIRNKHSEADRTMDKGKRSKVKEGTSLEVHFLVDERQFRATVGLKKVKAKR
jgi:hypothetical protein